ncbi:hypothetical protein Bca4012_000918 [Brassica carinata]|nr:uncharacterized protein LOC106432705 [Brassica napus]KAF3510124.1 hypothetical protein F2Q69_00000625 [Brassica cretica]KAH0888265.1 hypothetical protein HID58_050694 [Brassica napus]CAF1697506.1 unnamed protein product [Brassica napus]VDC86355.1 unnamed protein product [Brassica oleracea]
MRLIWDHLRVFFSSLQSMAIPPGLYSGTSSLALVARASAFSVGLLYGSMKLKVLKMTKKPHKVEATAHH